MFCKEKIFRAVILILLFTIFTLFSALVVLTSFTVSASIDEMVKALKEGNAAEIGRYDEVFGKIVTTPLLQPERLK